MHKLKLFKYSISTFLIAVFIFCTVVTLFFQPKTTKVDWEEAYKFKIPINELFIIEKVSKEYKIDFSKMTVCFMLENNFFKTDKNIEINDYIMNFADIKSKYTDTDFEKYCSIIKNIYSELTEFPVLIEKEKNNENVEYIYGDSFGAQRTYGGNRTHQGCDIMDRDNISGRLKIISMTDGVIEKIGWNEKGGWRVGIRSKNGNYYYYAHLKEYSENIYKGKEIKAGEYLGLMGNSGYSKTEGTTGMFETHLHIGIETKDKNWINPYPFLRLVENNKNID